MFLLLIAVIIGLLLSFEKATSQIEASITATKRRPERPIKDP
jgi:hypothetical protein